MQIVISNLGVLKVRTCILAVLLLQNGLTLQNGPSNQPPLISAMSLVAEFMFISSTGDNIILEVPLTRCFFLFSESPASSPVHSFGLHFLPSNIHANRTNIYNNAHAETHKVKNIERRKNNNRASSFQNNQAINQSINQSTKF